MPSSAPEVWLVRGPDLGSRLLAVLEPPEHRHGIHAHEAVRLRNHRIREGSEAVNGGVGKSTTVDPLHHALKRCRSLLITHVRHIHWLPCMVIPEPAQPPMCHLHNTGHIAIYVAWR